MATQVLSTNRDKIGPLYSLTPSCYVLFRVFDSKGTLSALIPSTANTSRNQGSPANVSVIAPERSG